MPERDEKNFQCFACLTSCALIFAVCTISLNILGYQYAESQDLDKYPDDRVYVIYHHDSFYVEYTVTRPVTLEKVEKSETYDYQEVKDYFDARCGGIVDQELCDDLDRLKQGGESWLGLNSAGIVVLAVACILQCFFLLAPDSIPKWSHWAVSGSCLGSAILFWAAFGSWQTAFTANKATDAILDYVLVQVLAINATEGWSYLDATMGASTILLLVCSILCLIAMFMSFRFSYDRQLRGHYYDMENDQSGNDAQAVDTTGPVGRV